MRGAVVDDPEDPPGGGVRLLRHHVVDEPVEGHDPAFGLRVAEDLRPLDVEGGEVGERAPALVGVLDSLPARTRGRGQRFVDARPGLDRGLLVGADNVVAGVEKPPSPPALVEVSAGPAFSRKAGSVGKTQERCCQGLSEPLAANGRSSRRRRR